MDTQEKMVLAGMSGQGFMEEMGFSDVELTDEEELIQEGIFEEPAISDVSERSLSSELRYSMAMADLIDMNRSRY